MGVSAIDQDWTREHALHVDPEPQKIPVCLVLIQHGKYMKKLALWCLLL